MANTLTLNTASSSFTGTLTVNRAQLALANGSLTSSAAFANLPSVVVITISNGGGLNIDNSGVNFSIDRINASSAITLLNTGANASVATVGLNYTSDQGNLRAPRVQNVGAVTLSGGANTIRVNANGTTALAQLNLASLTRSNGATLTLLASNMDDPLADRRGLVTLVSDANIISALVGTSSAVGSPSLRILPWAVGSNAGGAGAVAAGSLGNTFVSYGADGGFANGFRALATTEYENAGVLTASGAVTAINNVRYSSANSLTLTGTGHTVNSLVVENTSTTAGVMLVLAGSGAGDSLNVGSGAIIFAASGTPQPISFGGFGAGVTTSTSEYIITQNDVAAGGVLFSSPLTSAAALTKSGPGHAGCRLPVRSE